MGAHIADIGTDHAYLPVWLLKNGRIRCAIASDLRSGPLERARKTAQRFDLNDSISFRLCDGLSGIRADEVDTVVIAGMGGETISAILEAASWTGEGRHLFVLQPMSSIPDLRAWLQKHSFFIQKERIVAEGTKYYIVMLVRPGEMPPLTEGECLAGRQWNGMVSPLRMGYLEDLLYRIRRAQSELVRHAHSENLQKQEQMQIQIAQLQAMKEEWRTWQP